MGDFVFLGSKITADGDYRHKIKRRDLSCLTFLNYPSLSWPLMYFLRRLIRLSFLLPQNSLRRHFIHAYSSNHSMWAYVNQIYATFNQDAYFPHFNIFEMKLDLAVHGTP